MIWLRAWGLLTWQAGWGSWTRSRLHYHGRGGAYTVLLTGGLGPALGKQPGLVWARVLGLSRVAGGGSEGGGG